MGILQLESPGRVLYRSYLCVCFRWLRLLIRCWITFNASLRRPEETALLLHAATRQFTAGDGDLDDVTFRWMATDPPDHAQCIGTTARRDRSTTACCYTMVHCRWWRSWRRDIPVNGCRHSWSCSMHRYDSSTEVTWSRRNTSSLISLSHWSRRASEHSTALPSVSI